MSGTRMTSELRMTSKTSKTNTTRWWVRHLGQEEQVGHRGQEEKDVLSFPIQCQSLNVIFWGKLIKIFKCWPNKYVMMLDGGFQLIL